MIELDRASLMSAHDDDYVKYNTYMELGWHPLSQFFIAQFSLENAKLLGCLKYRRKKL
jgi:hypothetical protein